MTNFYLRTESIKSDEILELCVTNPHDENILDALSSSEPCLLEGSRGTGKSFLMKVSELNIENSSSNLLTVFVSFNISSLLRTDDPLQFYHWMLAKALKAFVNKLRKKGHLVSVNSANLLSKDETIDDQKIERDLSNIIKQFEDSYKAGQGEVHISRLPDIEDVKEAIENICEDNKLERVYFFFDEAAHVFRPEQQRQFFNLFKDLRSPYITCNAAIYPGVTYFGSSFEPTHDCIYRRIERDIRDADYLDYFKEIVYKQADDNLKASMDSNLEVFNTLALSCGGNPRILLRTIQELEKFNSKFTNETIKNFYRHQIWAEHTELGEKYQGHKYLIDWGRDFLENHVIPAIEQYNENRRQRNVNEASIYFWVHKDCPETVKESLRLLSYTSVLRKVDSAIRATRSELGSRYEVKYGCILALSSNPINDSKKFYKSLISKNFPEFGKNHSAYKDVKELKGTIEDEGAFQSALKRMLHESIDVLQLLTTWQKDKLKAVGITTIEELHQNTEDNLIEKIYNVGPVRARLIKNAATAELLEYLSG
jgi:hypothetical protein